MAQYFGRYFKHLDDESLHDLHTLELDSCIYTYLAQDDTRDFAYVRIRLTPRDVVRYVDAMVALDEFYEGLNSGLPPDDSLARVSLTTVRQAVADYNEWTRKSGLGGEPYCPAAFMGPELEELTCTNVPGRTEVLGNSYTADRQFLLYEIFESFPHVATFLADRDGCRPPYKVETEQDVRDLLYSMVKPIFPDAVIEDPTRKHAGSSKRIDLVIRDIETVIELKIVRDIRHGREVADELKVDIESYHSHPDCKRLIAMIWDPNHMIKDRVSLELDLAGERIKNGSKYVVELKILP